MESNEIKETKVMEIKALTISRRILDQIVDLTEGAVAAALEDPLTELGWINDKNRPSAFLFRRSNGHLIQIREQYLFFWQLGIQRSKVDNYTIAHDQAEKWMAEQKDRLPQIFVS